MRNASTYRADADGHVAVRGDHRERVPDDAFDILLTQIITDHALAVALFEQPHGGLRPTVKGLGQAAQPHDVSKRLAAERPVKIAACENGLSQITPHASSAQ